MTAPGIRSNNPGNLRSGEPWQGLADDQWRDGFDVFASPVWGLRALMLTLLAYYRKHHLETIREIINRWAPPVENDTGSYVADVSARAGIPADNPITLQSTGTLIALAKAIVWHENGAQPYDDATFELAAKNALVGAPIAAAG